jgi:lysozyme
MSVKSRVAVAALVLSSAGIGMWAAHESFTSDAIQPVKGDKWTYGYGSTTRPDGKPVQPGDSITPPQALRLIINDLSGKQETLRACFDHAVLHQHEWDAYVDLAGNVGGQAVCKSTIPAKLKLGEYEAACRTIPTFNKVQGRNCCLPENKRFCGGVCTRRKATEKLCLEGIYP